MAEFRFPKLDRQTAFAVAAVVYRAGTLADLGISELRYFQLFAHCALHGEFSVTYCEDEIVVLLAEAEGAGDRPRIPCPACPSVEPMNECRSLLYRQVPNPHQRS